MPNIPQEEPGQTHTEDEGVQLDLFDNLWAEKLRDKYGIANPMSED